MKKFVCSVCGYVHEGDSAPEACPVCKAPAEKFKEQTGENYIDVLTEIRMKEAMRLLCLPSLLRMQVVCPLTKHLVLQILI